MGGTAARWRGWGGPNASRAAKGICQGQPSTAVPSGPLTWDCDAIEALTLRMLATGIRTSRVNVLPPREQPMDLMDIHLIFDKLAQDSGTVDAKCEAQVPFEAFKRSFERLFYIMRERDHFCAKSFDEDQDGYVTWKEFYRVYQRRNITVKLSLLERTYLTFDNPDSSLLAYFVSMIIMATIIVSSGCFMIGTTPYCQKQLNPGSCPALHAIEELCLYVFVVEYVARLGTVWAVRMEVHDKAKLSELVTCAEPIALPSACERLWRFVLTVPNLVDLAAILPGVIGKVVNTSGGAFVVLRLVRLTRIFRVLKSPSLTAPVTVIGRTVHQSTKALYVLAFNLCVGIVIFGSLMYMAEGGADLNSFSIGGTWKNETRAYNRQLKRRWSEERQKWTGVFRQSPFQSIPHAFWWAIVTVTTVGYGDDYPVTILGRVIAIATMVFSMVILALPVGVIGGTFSQEWDKYQQDLQEKADLQEREMAAVTGSIKTLDPVKISNMVLLEVWHDHPQLLPQHNGRPAATTFMGQVEVELSLPAGQNVSGEFCLPLEENYTLVQRNVSGQLRVRYTWTPTEIEPVCCQCDDVWKVQPFKPDMLAGREFHMQGILLLTVIAAEGVINLGTGGRLSNPYCTVLCFPTYSAEQMDPQPSVWRTATATGTLNPRWVSSQAFNFHWSKPPSFRTSESRLFSTAGRQQSSRTAVESIAGPAHWSELRAGTEPVRQASATEPPRRSGATCPDRAAAQELMDIIGGLSNELRKQRTLLRGAQRDVGEVSGRVEQLSAMQRAVLIPVAQMS